METGEWPVSRSFSAYNIVPTGNSVDIDRDSSTPKRESSTPCSLPDGSEMITITPDQGNNAARVVTSVSSASAVANVLNQSPFNQNVPSLSITPTGPPTGFKRKRHIAIDVETERGEQRKACLYDEMKAQRLMNMNVGTLRKLFPTYEIIIPSCG